MEKVEIQKDIQDDFLPKNIQKIIFGRKKFFSKRKTRR